MRLVSRFVTFFLTLLILVAFSTTTLLAAVHTTASPKARINSKIDNNKRTTLYGHVPPALRSAQDLGRVEPSKLAEHLILVMKSDENQKHELRRILDEQQDARTVNYHQWVTPEEFGAHFGVHDSDIAQVQAWLKSQGFKVEDVAKSKRAIHFTGTVSQLEQAFQMQMHYYLMSNGEVHVSNDRDITVPTALAPVVAGVPTLHNFFRKSHSQFGKTAKIRLGPKYTSSSSVHYVAPADFATIYNTAPLLAAGVNGTGSSIAIVGRSDINLSDVETYRQMFQLPANDPVFIHAGQDQGILPGDDGESYLDVEQSGGVAPGATIDFVIGTPSFLVDGITNSTEYIIEHNVADIMSVSYGDCEANEGSSGNAFNAQMFEQGAAQGISIFIAAGDNAAAGCDDQNDSWENLGYATGAEASTPYSIGVGGTQFYNDNGTTYWSATTATNFSSALKYMPEYPWNESKGASPTSSPSADLSGLWSGSGGVSAYYLRPSWQTGSGINNATDPVLTQGGNWVTSYTITNPGSGYTTAPTVAFAGGGCINEPSVATGGSNTGSVTISGGQVTALNFNFGTQGGTLETGLGFGCTSAPTLTFSAPTSGTTATATVTVGPMQGPPPLVSGVPHRLTPDVALNAASGHDATLYCAEGVCQFSTAPALVNAGLVGGTSVAAPSMAGVQAIINQVNGGRQGMPGYIYYQLAAAQNTANCNSSTPPAAGSNCAFQDITTGNNEVCGTSACSGTTARMGFAAGAGYDLATGLGSPNVANLASQWSSVVFNSSVTTLSLSSTSFAQGTSVTLSGTVAAGSGGGTPTGDVAFIVSQGAIDDPVNPTTGYLVGPVSYTTLSGGSYSLNLTNLPGGTYNVTARYGGDSTYGSSYSAPVQVTVAGGSTATVTLTPYALSGVACTISPASTFTYDSQIILDVQVSDGNGNGTPTGSVTLTLDGNTYATLPLDPNGHAYAISGIQTTSNSCLWDYMPSQQNTLPAGSHSLTASYSGDSSFSGATSSPAAFTVTQLTPTITLTAPADITSGASVQLGATLGGLPAAGQSTGTAGPTGTITFTDTTTSTVLGTATVNTVTHYAPLTRITTFISSGGSATTTGITQAGANSITATYSGDSNWASVTSTAATTTVGTLTASTTTLTASPNPATFASAPTFTATMSPTAATGTVSFYDGTYYMGSSTISTSAHTATYKPATSYAFTGGSHSISAVYSGSATYASSTGTMTEAMTQGTVTQQLTAETVSTSPLPTGTNITFTDAIVPSSTSSSYAPVGYVNFYDGGTLIGTSSTPVVGVSSSSTYGGYGIYSASFSTSSLAAGTHTITAKYAGDTNYAASASASNSQTITVGSSQTITFTTNAPSSAGDGSNFTVAATASSGLTVAFTSYGSCTNSGATYTMTKSTGTCYVIANQKGNSSNGPAPEVTQTTAATIGSQTITFTTPPPASASDGSHFTVAATASSGLAVSFTSSGACTNAGATYTITASSGTCSVIANQAGNTNFTAAPTVTDTVNATQASTSTAVLSSLNPSGYGQAVSFTATVTGVSPSGTVAFSIDGNPFDTETLVSGSAASVSISNLAVGTHTVTATYSGDTNNTGSTGTLAGGQVVTSANAGVSIASSLNPSVYGQSVTFTATISGANGLVKGRKPGKNGIRPQDVTGSVTWSDSNGPLTCTETGSSTTTVTSGNPGTATCTTSALAVAASDTITGAYSGDSNHNAGSGTVNQQITASNGNVSVASGLNPSTYGQSVTFTATVTGDNGMAKRKGAKPFAVTGSVSWSANTGCSTSTVSGYPGTATCTTSILPVGASDTVTASYSGDANHNAGSGSVSQTVTAVSSSVSVGSTLNPSGYGQSVSFTATVSGNSPTGTVQFNIDGNPFDTETLVSGSATSASTSSLTAGTHTVTATYSGDTNNAGATGTLSGGQVVNSANSSMSVGSSQNPSTYAQQVTFTATITTDTGDVKGRTSRKKNGMSPMQPTGTVTWSVNTGCAASTLSGSYPGVATCTTSSASHLPVGTDTVTASYSGDSNHTAASGSVSQVVTGGIATTIDVTSVSPSSEEFGANSPVTITAVLSWTGHGVA
ncbi:MAG: Ig-like domain repeat protein, partial [Terriglobales bacterium]